MSLKPFSKFTTIESLQFMIGKRIRKCSGKPFKSKLKAATVVDIIEHPQTQRPAFLLKEDGTIVAAIQCELYSDE